MAPGIVPLRARAGWAERAAGKVMRRPSLYSVVIVYETAEGSTETTHCGFQRERRSWWGRPLLDVCQVRVREQPETAVVTSYGTYRRGQYRALAAIKDHPFPPRTIDLSELVVEPGEARDLMLQVVAGHGPGEPRCLGLGLVLGDEGLAWRGTVDVPGGGVHTLILGATDGRVLLSKFDPYVSGAKGGWEIEALLNTDLPPQ